MLNEKVELHGNLNKRLMSIRIAKSGAKVQHLQNAVVTIRDGRFRVRDGCFNRIRSNGHREVCAHVVGVVDSVNRVTVDGYEFDNEYIRVSFDPKTFSDRNFFYRVDTNERIEECSEIVCVVTESSRGRTRLNTYVKKELV